MNFSSILCLFVLHLGSYTTRHSTIWPDMGPADLTSLRNRFERIESVLMLHEQRMEEAAAHARQAAEAQAQAIAALTAQLQQLTSQSPCLNLLLQLYRSPG